MNEYSYEGFHKRGSPKWMVYMEKSHEHGWFRGTPIVGNHHISIYILVSLNTNPWSGTLTRIAIFPGAKDTCWWFYHSLRIAPSLEEYTVYPLYSSACNLFSRACCSLKLIQGNWTTLCMYILLYLYYRRTFRSQISDNMDKWKAQVGRIREEKREKIIRKKMQVREKVEKLQMTVSFSSDLWFRRVEE